MVVGTAMDVKHDGFAGVLRLHVEHLHAAHAVLAHFTWKLHIAWNFHCALVGHVTPLLFIILQA